VTPLRGRVAFLGVVALGWLLEPAEAFAGDPLGTAGAFRKVAWAQCQAGVLAQFRGACDPAPVDANLPAAQQSQAHMTRARELLSLGRVPQSRDAVDAAIKLDPRNVAAFKLRARFEMPGGSATIAEANVNAGLALAPSDSDLLAMRALSLQDRDPAGAMREANQAVKNDPLNTDVLWLRARILLAEKRLEDAEKDLTKALDLEPDYFRARHLRAAVRVHLKRYADALDDANRALTQNPGDVAALQLRAVARAALGDLGGLVSDLTEVLGEPGQPLNADPSVAMFNGLYIQRAMALVRLGRHADAMQDVATVTRQGGQQAILRMQIYLRSNGFPDVPLNGKRSELFDDAMKACFIDQACGRGIAERI
jgi:tetratricopeptide (TPR) repeat protein